MTSHYFVRARKRKAKLEYGGFDDEEEEMDCCKELNDKLDLLIEGFQTLDAKILGIQERLTKIEDCVCEPVPPTPVKPAVSSVVLETGDSVQWAGWTWNGGAAFGYAWPSGGDKSRIMVIQGTLDKASRADIGTSVSKWWTNYMVKLAYAYDIFALTADAALLSEYGPGGGTRFQNVGDTLIPLNDLKAQMVQWDSHTILDEWNMQTANTHISWEEGAELDTYTVVVGSTGSNVFNSLLKIEN